MKGDTMMKKSVLYLLLVCILLSGCAFENSTENEEKIVSKKDLQSEKIENLLSKMSLEEKIYQMMFVTSESITGEKNVTRAISKNELEMHPVGGVIYFSPNFVSKDQTINMIQNTKMGSKIPLFVGVDEEGGKVARLSDNKNIGFPSFSSMRKIGDTKNSQNAYDVGLELGINLEKCGFNVDFAPVADVILNEKNTEIGSRSFGTDANLVSKMVGSFVNGMEKTGVLSVLKHFPDHGSTVVNSHNGYSESNRTLDEIKSFELLPFKKGIEEGSSFVLVSHMTLPNAVKEKVPCTLSKEIITDLLKKELGFEGIVITDSMSMGAITKEYLQKDAVIKSINAGSDMILMPLNVKKTAEDIKEAVENGIISEERINDSVRRILRIKMDKFNFM
jgi:beta-N-acetylhexosaminidase